MRPEVGKEALIHIISSYLVVRYAVWGLGVLLFLSGCQTPHPPSGADVLSYTYTLHFPDRWDLSFPFEAEIMVHRDRDELGLSLVRKRFWRDGAVVHSVKVSGISVPFSHSGRALLVSLPRGGDTVMVSVSGTTMVPSPWRHGNLIATDPWPDRSSWWLPVSPNPIDEAFHHYVFTAPDGVVVLAEGTRHSPVRDSSDRIRYSFTGSRPLVPAVSAVIAGNVLIFSEIGAGKGHWALASDTARAIRVSSRLPEALEWLTLRLGPLPFERIETVYLPTRFLGMEYAGLPRVHLGRIGGDLEAQDILVHEWVHQWIGASRFPATPADLWVTEGLATYLTALYRRDQDGLSLPIEQWMWVVERFVARHPGCVYENAPSLNDRLTPHVYQRGALVWHALRNEVGDSAFWSAVRVLAQGKGLISSREVKHTFEAEAGRPLDSMWRDWVLSRDFPPSEGGTQTCG